MQKTPEVFDARNEQKKKIEFVDDYPTDVRVGEFWRYWEGVNVGNEISKDGRFRRVCLVLKTDLGNGLIRVIPITTKYHKWLDPYLIKVMNWEKFPGLKECWLLTNQIKFIDKRRLLSVCTDQMVRGSFIRFVIKKCTDLLQK